MKKIISIILIMTILINIFPPATIFAYEGTGKTSMDEATIDYDTYKKDSEEGASDVGGAGRKGYNLSDSVLNSIVKNVIKFFNVIPTVVSWATTILTKDDNADEINKTYGKNFSIQKLVFNKIEILDINFFDRSAYESELVKTVRNHIAKFYYAIRNIAIVAMLIVLIYTGIRMAISVIATEKAKYKTMLVNWASGLIIIIVMPYIMNIILYISDQLLELMEALMNSVCGSEIYEIEETLLSAGINSTEKGFSLIIPTIIYWVLVFYQVKFLWIYSKRLFSTAFLVVISPLVLVQYVFDKVGDNEASSFKIWMTEYSLNVLIQPLHAFLYMIFMTMTLNIMEEAPILSVVFLATMTRGERVLRNILRIKNSQTVQSMKDNVSASNMAKQIGG